jgi:hypothetical protein
VRSAREKIPFHHQRLHVLRPTTVPNSAAAQNEPELDDPNSPKAAEKSVERQPPAWRKEREARIALAACYRIFDLLGWTEMIFNHITLRVRGPERHFLLNAFGLWYREVTASNLVKIDLEGNTVGPSEYPVNRAGFVIHSAIHAARGDAHCIMRTHSTAGMAVACQRDGLAPDNFYSALLARQDRLPRFRGHQPPWQREAATRAGARRQEPAHPAQPRPLGLRPQGAGGLPANVDPGARLPDPMRRAIDRPNG